MTSGGLIILDPWVPEDQIKREVVVVGKLLDGRDGLILVADEPLGWNDEGFGNVLVVVPRYTGESMFGKTKAYVNGYVWLGRWKDSLAFTGQLDLEEPISG